MYIIRTKSRKEVKTFEFANLHEAEIALGYVNKTSAGWFMAEVKEPTAMKGRIVETAEEHKPWSSLSYNIRSGPYRDTEWGVLGTEDECKTAADATNAKVVCWASITASARHIAGSLWATEYCDPYKD